MIEKRVTRNEHGDAVLTITVTGAWDVYRFARHMQCGQCEFAWAGTLVLRSLERQMGRHRFDQLALYLEGKLPFRRRRPTVTPERAAALARGEL